MQTLAWRQVSNVLVTFETSINPSDPEWDTFLDAVETAFAKPRVDGLLVYTMGGGPSGSQRKRGAQMIERVDGTPRIAVVDVSALNRGIIAAFNFIIRTPIKPFRPSALRDALDYLQIPAADRTETIDTLRILAAEFKCEFPATS
jgi:hypothetical protein